MIAQDAEKQTEEFRRHFDLARKEMAKAVVGNDDIVQGVLTSLLSSGHALLEGIPGLGKTRIVQTLSEVLDLEFSRIQFTPDLMPGDILGHNVLLETESGEKQLDFQPGPIFANIVLADEVNRATPKTQSALLEAMQEKSVTLGRSTYRLKSPFFVLATQNPLEMEGTYPLPEAQLDRFFFKLQVEYPDIEAMHEILNRTTSKEEIRVSRVLNSEQILSMQRTVREVPIARMIQDYAIRITLATHPESEQAHPLAKRYVRFGASPRGTQALVIGAKVHALLQGRVYVSSQDVRAVVLPALRHRVLLNFEGEAERVDPDDVLQEILKTLAPPKE